MGSPGALARQAPPPRAPLPPPGSTPPASRTPRGTWPRRWRRTWRGKPKRRCWPTRRLSCQEPASRMQSRIAARPPPWKTSPMALTRPRGIGYGRTRCRRRHGRAAHAGSRATSHATPCPPPIRRAPASSRTRRSLSP